MKCTCNKCKSCSNRRRTGIKYNWKNKMIGKKNPMWKGDKVGYISLHDWVRRHKPKIKFCEECNKVKPYDLANISGEYKRDVNDFRWLCRSCHMKSDVIRIKNLKHKPTCKDCGKIVSYGSIRCIKCSKIGENNPNYIHGRCIKNAMLKL